MLKRSTLISLAFLNLIGFITTVAVNEKDLEINL